MVRFLEFTGPATKFEDGDFTPAALADANRHDRRANAGPSRPHRSPPRLDAAAACRKAVHVLVAADLAQSNLVETRHGYLAAMGVSG